MAILTLFGKNLKNFEILQKFKKVRKGPKIAIINGQCEKHTVIEPRGSTEGLVKILICLPCFVEIMAFGRKKIYLS